jgi:hypothetical protein
MRNVLFALLVLALGPTTALADPPWADKLFTNGTTHDFGTVAKGTQLHHSFKLHNIYDVPLEVNARSGCGCVTLAQTNLVLQRLKDGTLDITMDTRRVSGEKKVDIQITVSAPNFLSSTTLRVTANARTDVVLNPGQISLGVVPQGQKSTPQELDIEYAGQLDWRVTEMVKNNAPLEATFKEIYRRPGQIGYRITVAARADAPVGAVKNELFLKTNDPETPLVAIPVEGTVQASLSVAPNPVPLGNLKVGDTVTKMVVMRGNKPFRVVSVEGQKDGVVAELPTAAKEVQIIKVKCQPTKTGDVICQLRFKTDLDQESTVTVKVEGNVVP